MAVRVNTFGAILVILLLVANVVGAIILGIDLSDVRGATRSSYNIAEAAYLGAVWTQLAAKACVGIFLNIVVMGWILLNLELEDPHIHQHRDQVISELQALQGRPLETTESAEA